MYSADVDGRGHLNCFLIFNFYYFYFFAYIDLRALSLETKLLHKHSIKTRNARARQHSYWLFSSIYEYLYLLYFTPFVTD